MVNYCSRICSGIDCVWSKNNIKQLKLNMFVASLFQLHISMSQTMTFSSIYLFVTSCRNCSEQLSTGAHNTSDVQLAWPGLGESDFYYSVVSMSRGAGLLVGSFIAGFLPACIPFRVSILMATIFCLLANVLHANTTQGWMMIVVQFLGLGMSIGMLYVFFLTYVSNTCAFIEESETSFEDKTEKSEVKQRYGLKDKFLTMNCLLRNIGWPLGLAISSVMAQFEQTVDQFRWPGWAVTFSIVIFTLLFLLVYRNIDTKVEKSSREGVFVKFRRALSKRCSSRPSLNLKAVTFRDVIVYTYIMFAGYLSYSLATVSISTLVSPALSDHFGFSLAHISYFNLGVMVIAFGASLVMLSLKIVKLNNRIVLIVSVIIGVAGTMLATDWQAFGQDPCSLQFMNNTTIYAADVSNSNLQEINQSMFNSSDRADICMEGSSESQECYWNPISRITGTLCSLCRPVCRTESMSINFVQFSLGMSLITVSSLLLWIAVVAVATDCTTKDAQSKVLGMLHTTAGVSTITTPLWCIWIYDAFGKRLFGPMLVCSLLGILAVMGCIILYKQLEPITRPSEKTRKEDKELEVQEELNSSKCDDSKIHV